MSYLLIPGRSASSQLEAPGAVDRRRSLVIAFGVTGDAPHRRFSATGLLVILKQK